MVLADLGQRITGALSKMRNTTIIDEQVVDDMLKEIGNALVAADVQLMLVLKLRKNIKKAIDLPNLPKGVDQRRVIKKAVFDELINLLDSNGKPFKPKKGHPNVVMFVGLQGAGKTTTVSKMAYYYKRKGWNPCLVCADTFRAGAFDQLKQNATKIKIPFYGSYTETDPVKVAQDGVNNFKNENIFDIIIVDTSGRHKQEEALFEEMSQVFDAVEPDNVIFVMDGSIGQAAYDQAQAFKSRVDVGSVIITKLDGRSAKGGGALSAVAATESPVAFIGTGEHMDDFEEFDSQSFVSRLLGMGDVKGMMKAFSDAMPADKAPEMVQRLSEGKFTLRDMYEQLQSIMKMGPINKVMEMMPGMSNMMPQGLKGVDGNKRLKMMLNIMDSMTDQELDSDKPLKDPSRIVRIARGSGRSVREVSELAEQHKQFAKMVQKMKSLGKMSGRPGDLNKMASMVPPHIMKQMGGMGGLNNLMKQLGDGMNLPGMGGLGGLGGLGGFK